ncbi:alpha/beta-hydrolase [Epithele typhae]|uniref:alpha/beta-hydrolase n=1 Tax=Epithele typhae TaxID=378194 RepID=UPI002007BBA3|nr:alpha/beta-hydrolase [Epithele typhae]KAH9939004.1 alpha/beta-hydrolase [Epithele typhae]
MSRFLGLGSFVSVLAATPGVLSVPRAAAPTIEWAPCESTIAVSKFPIDCAFFPIPLDYADPSAGTGRLSLIKMNATGERKGTLFTNPGGPDEGGVSDLAFNGMQYMNVTGGNYDLVSWDPRGVGTATIPSSVFCFDSFDEWSAFFNGTLEVTGINYSGNLTDPGEVAGLMAQARTMQDKYVELGGRCATADIDGTYKYVGTAANARDLAALAEAIDGPGAAVNYWGMSYGTLMGAWLVNMFPNRVGHVILDGVVNVLDTAEKQSYFSWADKTKDSEKVWEGMATACALSGPSHCNLTTEGGTGQDVMALLSKLLDAATDAQKHSSGPVTIQSSVTRGSVFGDLYLPESWQGGATLIARLVPLVEAESGMTVRPTRKRRSETGMEYGMTAIYCGDSIDADESTMEDVFDTIVTAVQNGPSPTFAGLFPYVAYYCPWWPARAVERYTGHFNKTLSNPALIIGNTFDPITPFSQAQTLADLMGDSATLVRQNGFGHRSLAQASECTSKIIQDYLNNDALPAGDATVCEVDAVELFPGVVTSDVVKMIS